MGEEKFDIQEFYGDFAKDKGEKYLTEIRRFGLRYDDMVGTVVDVATMDEPDEVLDIGSGIGNVEEMIFAKSPKSTITCVELSPQMVEVAQKRLEKYNQSKLKFFRENILDFQTDNKFDTIVSNLALHNLSTEGKLVVLEKIKQWLKPSGVFVWGDFMDWEDKNVGKFYMDERRRKVLESGAPKELVDEVLAKEAGDHRLTVVETVDMLSQSGFTPEVLWVYSFLAVFRAKVKINS